MELCREATETMQLKTSQNLIKELMAKDKKKDVKIKTVGNAVTK